MKPRRQGREPRTPAGARHHPGKHAELAVLRRAHHDMRSPLSVIVGVFELLEDSGVLRDGERRYLKLGSEAAAELLTQADALHLHSALAQGLVDLAPTAVDLAQVVRSGVVPALSERRVRLRAVPAGCPPARADAGYLELACAALGRHLAAHLPDSAAPRGLGLTWHVHGDDEDAVTVTLQADAAPDRATDACPAPGEADLAVVNAVQLIELMGGRVALDAGLPYLRIVLPAAA